MRLLNSFSGGRTSGYMSKRLVDEFSSKHEIVTVFANTGQEREETLRFVNECGRRFGLNCVWVEAVAYHGERKGSGHKVVNFETASRNGEPFEEIIKKYGIPNMSHPHCTRELKKNAIESYARSIGWGNDYLTAIGIRADEKRRVNEKATEAMIVYPLIDWFPTDKIDVLEWWKDQDFDLGLLEHQGNCTWCWKKSFNKHALILHETPEVYDFPARMEKLYGHIGPEKEAGAFPRVFFRQNHSTESLRNLCSGMVDVMRRQQSLFNEENAGCSESCELYEAA